MNEDSLDQHVQTLPQGVSVIDQRPRHRAARRPQGFALDPLGVMAGTSAIGAVLLLTLIALKWFGLI